jgi:hypothetical protein
MSMHVRHGRDELIHAKIKADYREFLAKKTAEFRAIEVERRRIEDDCGYTAAVPEHAPEAPRVETRNDEIIDGLRRGSFPSMSCSGYVPTNPRPAALVALANKGWQKRKAGDAGVPTLWRILGTLPRNRSFPCFTSAKELFHAPR